jgi:integrase
MGQLLTKGASEGYQSLTVIDTSSLRPRKTQRDRDGREAYSEADVQAIFRHPVWQGSGKRKSWDQPGNFIDQNGLYWLPLIAALTGARRAEIAGLMPDEIMVIEGIPTIRFKPNAIRGLKTLASTRDVPMHPQLIELGLLARAQRLAVSGRGRGRTAPPS